MNTKGHLSQKSLIIGGLASALIVGVGLWTYYDYRKDTIAEAEVADTQTRRDNARIAQTWCERASKKLKVGKIEDGKALLERCAAVPGHFGKQMVAYYYLDGTVGLPRDIAKAEAIAQTMTGPGQGAMFLTLGTAYYQGARGAVQDIDKGLDYWERAGAMGSELAWQKLAAHYTHPGYSDPERSAFYAGKFKDTRVGKELGLQRALALLNSAFPEERKEGAAAVQAYLDKHPVEAKITIENAKKIEAINTLARYWLSGQDGPPDIKQAVALLDRVEVNEFNHAILLAHTYRLGLRGEPDFDKARELYEYAESDYTPIAKLALGHMHRLGMGVAADPARAMAYYQDYVAAGIKPQAACQFIGHLHQTEALGPPDYAKARAAYQAGIDGGNVTCKVMMARLYEHGLGVAIDPAKAFTLMEEAALSGSNMAREGMADYLERGIGTERNFPLARIWRNKIRPPKDPLAFECDICDPKTE